MGLEEWGMGRGGKGEGHRDMPGKELSYTSQGEWQKNASFASELLSLR